MTRRLQFRLDLTPLYRVALSKSRLVRLEGGVCCSLCSLGFRRAIQQTIASLIAAVKIDTRQVGQPELRACIRTVLEVILCILQLAICECIARGVDACSVADVFYLTRTLNVFAIAGVGGRLRRLVGRGHNGRPRRDGRNGRGGGDRTDVIRVAILNTDPVDATTILTPWIEVLVLVGFRVSSGEECDERDRWELHSCLGGWVDDSRVVGGILPRSKSLLGGLGRD